MANFDSEFFGLVFPGFQATQKIHAQNSRPELSASLSNFTFLNPKFIHGDFLLTGETKRCLSRPFGFLQGIPCFFLCFLGGVFLSEELKKAVAVSEEKIQQRSRRRGQFSSCQRIGEEFSSSVQNCRKTFPAANFGQPQPSRVF